LQGIKIRELVEVVGKTQLKIIDQGEFLLREGDAGIELIGIPGASIP